MEFKVFKVKLQKIITIIPTLILAVSLIAPAAAKDEKESALKYKTLQSTSFDECLFVGETAIEVKYKKKHFTYELGMLTVQATQDGNYFYAVSEQELEKGKGSIVLFFDAGECVLDIKLSIE